MQKVIINFWKRYRLLGIPLVILVAPFAIALGLVVIGFGFMGFIGIPLMAIVGAVALPYLMIIGFMNAGLSGWSWIGIGWLMLAILCSLGSIAYFHIRFMWIEGVLKEF